MDTQEIFTADSTYAETHFRGVGFAEPVHAEMFKTLYGDLPIASFRYRILKPLVDLLMVLLVLPIALPLGLVVAALIRLSSRGPVLYRHLRIGQYQQPLYVWKFRTMYESSDSVLEEHLNSNSEAREEWERTQKLKDDPRVTPLGQLLRKTSLDEIPQLLNVLSGKMSVVGPRPIVDDERPKYGEHFRTYTFAVPGITGLWQVSGRSSVDYPERVLMDVEYVERWSFWMELKILFKTIPTILKRTGAY
jgi:lipopolysaccharide/colanic/teichoic acid biosynthesis glycosyltransferase